jgi:hypothetical protein
MDYESKIVCQMQDNSYSRKGILIGGIDPKKVAGNPDSRGNKVRYHVYGYAFLYPGLADGIQRSVIARTIIIISQEHLIVIQRKIPMSMPHLDVDVPSKGQFDAFSQLSSVTLGHFTWPTNSRGELEIRGILIAVALLSGLRFRGDKQYSQKQGRLIW